MGARLSLEACRMLTLSGTGGEGGRAESARAGFNLRELPCYLSNTYEILPLKLLKFIGEKDFIKILCQGYNLLPWQTDFRRNV